MAECIIFVELMNFPLVLRLSRDSQSVALSTKHFRTLTTRPSSSDSPIIDRLVVVCPDLNLFRVPPEISRWINYSFTLHGLDVHSV